MALSNKEMADLVAASHTVESFFHNLDAKEERQIELPSVRARREKQFIHIPLPVFEVVVSLPGKAGYVYELLWRRYHMEKKPSTVQLTAGERKRCKLTRRQTALAYEVLEKAGLIKVERRVGKSPRITLCPVAGLAEGQEPTS
jgi:hypothetical protein